MSYFVYVLTYQSTGYKDGLLLFLMSSPIALLVFKDIYKKVKNKTSKDSYLTALFLFFMSAFLLSNTLPLLPLYLGSVESVGSFEKYPLLKKELNFVEYEGDVVINTQWYTQEGKLINEKKQEWCNISINKMDTVNELYKVSSFAPKSIDGLLSSVMWSTIRENECITDEQLLDKSYAIIDNISSKISTQDKIINKLSNHSILAFYLSVSSSNAERVAFLSPKKVCINIGSRLYGEGKFDARIYDECNKEEYAPKTVIDFKPIGEEN